MASLKTNTITSYLSQGYAAIIGIAVMPFLFSTLGSDAFGLIGFFTVAQVIINLLGSGFNPTLSREIAKEKIQYQNTYLISVIKSFELIFFCFLLLILIVALFANNWFAIEWFESDLPVELLSSIVLLIFIVCAVRFQSVLYLSALRGSEDFLWINSVSIIINTLRFPISLLLVIYYPSLKLYFGFHLIIAMVELLVMRYRIGKLLGINFWLPDHFSFYNVKKLGRFAKAVAITAVISVVIAQADKVLMSKLLTLSEYGYFTVCIMLANGILLLGFPIGTVLIPRLTALYADGKLDEFRQIYIKFTKFVCIFIVPGAIVLAGFSQNIIYLFTGSTEAANWGKDILSYYTLGNAFLIVAGFQYYQQVAKGDLKYHVRYSMALLLCSLPLIMFFGSEYGVIAVAIIWLFFRVFAFIFWVPYIHAKMKTIKYSHWLFQAVLPSLLVSIIAYALLKEYDENIIENKVTLLVQLVGFYMTILVITFFSYKLVLNKKFKLGNR
ncbi:oligosaccharide flippase family protein [Colwellia sp. BRX8-5]|uniref:lipopolysaccharide biosynthesis protein n=3 Tax=unclassified Colwellia TaxID=196834 RepID=UPI0015F49EBD|nr:oligosaccharide flippase family protein [Colwellia sp. BRX8-5]MBA6368666.1 oligosaccharide flippase family protein [Colwellia sp. BRX8-5]